MKNDQENDRGDVSESWSEPIYFTFRVSESATLSAKGKQLWRRMTAATGGRPGSVQRPSSP
ncbi:MAG: hypothetical protein WDN02_05225 [Methylovirgula sp.]|uniref:hypothetical protein n=1 Tax=Methylovirgula sp. TaxID=1978224 RepID=UPI0030764C3E